MKKFRCIHIAILAFLFTLVTTAQEKPNILFIAIDDMNDWIGPLGGLGDLPRTPNLDRLARQSVTFSNAHCASPACSPSRLSIMSGTQPSRSGNMRNEWYDGPGWRKDHIFRDVETIEHLLSHSLSDKGTRRSDPTGSFQGRQASMVHMGTCECG